MRSRKLFSILAVLGVLLHAGAIVRHNALMTGAVLQYQALVDGLAQLCHSGTSSNAGAELPYLPQPSDAQAGCPICSGLAPAAVAPAPELATLVVALPVLMEFWTRTHSVVDSTHAVCPPARGPPAVA